jgi:hypothetical protein
MLDQLTCHFFFQHTTSGIFFQGEDMRNPLRRRKNHKLLKIIGGAALAALGIRLFPDLRRYLKIIRM